MSPTLRRPQAKRLPTPFSLHHNRPALSLQSAEDHLPRLFVNSVPEDGEVQYLLDDLGIDATAVLGYWQARADRLAALKANQDSRLMASAWSESMAFGSRRSLAEIGCPTLVVAASDNWAEHPDAEPK